MSGVIIILKCEWVKSSTWP